MGFDDFFGNRAIVDALRGMLARDRLPHALLFAGPVAMLVFAVGTKLFRSTIVF